MDRRDAIGAAAAALLTPLIKHSSGTRIATQAPDFAAIERGVGGRLGVSAWDTASGRRLGHRAQERFPMCSTFKWLLAARVLSRVDASQEQLARDIPYGARDLLEYAPVTRAHVKEGRLSVGRLAEAAVQQSDNTAANLLLRTVGGPAGLTAWLRTIGDRVTRLDRNEPALNAAAPRDPRDTTTPDAMVADLHELLLGTRLAAPSREQLTTWLTGNKTGDARIRPGAPAGWRIGDKTGTGAHGSTNDVAIIWPPSGAPILVAAYLTLTAAAPAVREAALASVGRAVTQWAANPGA